MITPLVTGFFAQTQMLVQHFQRAQLVRGFHRGRRFRCRVGKGDLSQLCQNVFRRQVTHKGITLLLGWQSKTAGEFCISLAVFDGIILLL